MGKIVRLGSTRALAAMLVGVAVLAACNGGIADEAATVVETSSDRQTEGPAGDSEREAEEPTAVASRLDIDGAEFVDARWTATVDGFSLRLAWEDTDFLGQVDSRVARPGLYFAAARVDVANPLDDRAAPGVADELSLQVAVAEGPEGCPGGASSSRVGDESRWCLLPSTVDPPLSGDFSAGEVRTVSVIADEPLPTSEMTADRLAVAVAVDTDTVLIRRSGGETVGGALVLDGEGVEDVRIVLMDENRRPVGEATSGDGGEWVIETGGPGEFIVMLDQRTLPEGVMLRDPSRDELSVHVRSGQEPTVLFPFRR